MVIRRMIVGVMVLGASLLLAGVAGAHYDESEHGEACNGPAQVHNPHCRGDHPGNVTNGNGNGNENGNEGGNDDEPEPVVLPDTTDTDRDGIPDAHDNCSTVPNTSQRNTDGDDQGDACDRDDDNDRVADTADNCPDHANRDQADRDGDGKGDACDPRALDEANDAVDRTEGTARAVVEYAEWEIERHAPQQVRDARDAVRDAVAEIRDAAGL